MKIDMYHYSFPKESIIKIDRQDIFENPEIDQKSWISCFSYILYVSDLMEIVEITSLCILVSTFVNLEEIDISTHEFKNCEY